MRRCLVSIALIVTALSGCSETADEQPTQPSVKSESTPAPVTGETPPAGQSVPELPAAFKITSFKWDGPMQAGESLRLRNPYGDIRCRRSGTGELIVSAQIQTFTDWQQAPQFEVVDDDGSFEVRIVHPQPVRVEFGGDYKQGFAGRVDVTVLLPADTSADLATLDGALRVKNFSGNLKATTVSGDLYYASSGEFLLQTSSGAVAATVTDFSSLMTGEIRTDNGSVDLWLAANAMVTVDADSAGEINFSPADGVDIETNRSEDRLLLKLRGGGRPLKISSESGDIEIHVD